MAVGDSKRAPKTEEMPQIVVDENIGGFCSIDPRTGRRIDLTLREKESLFLDAMQAYFRGESALSNDEFDALKEELTWQGSDVVTLSREEFMFLDAVKAFEQGAPTMADEEFDALKVKLQNEGSIVAIQRGPRCSIRRQITYSDVVRDRRRTFVLFVPAGLLMSLVWLSGAFELTPLHQIDPVLSLIIGSPFIFVTANFLTKLIVRDPVILVGDCPNCGRRTHVLFGNVLNLKGFDDSAEVDCSKCRASLRIEKETSRMILLSEGKAKPSRS